MVSTRQSSYVGSSGDGGINESGGVKTRHSYQQSKSLTTTYTNQYGSTQNSTNDTCTNSSRIHILDLPQEILDKIFSYVGYKNVSQMRLVCRQFNSICSSVLNSTFQQLQTQMLQSFNGIKAKMPRRESARRNHPLACESDIVETLHMRLTLLQMAFGKHIERKHCCFFAGEILDEVYKIMHYIRVTPKLSRPYRVTDELFDLSTMAMEYFKEHIEPTLPEITYFGTDFLDFTPNGISSGGKKSWMLDSPPHNGSKAEYESPSAGEGEKSQENSSQPQCNTFLRKRIRKIKLGMKKYNSRLALYKRELRSCKAKLLEQQKQFLEMASRMDDNDKKNDENTRKFSTLLQELNKCKTELQYWRSKSPLSLLCPSCGHKNLSGGTASFMEDLMVGISSNASKPVSSSEVLCLDKSTPISSAVVVSTSTAFNSPNSATPCSSNNITSLPPSCSTSTLEPVAAPAPQMKRKTIDETPIAAPKISKKCRLKPMMLQPSVRTRRS